MKIVFASLAWDDFLHWQATDPSVSGRLIGLIGECRRSPFRGIGKPEPLKDNWTGWWSRRLTKQDRLIYRVTGKGDEQRLEIAQCRFHY